jgi:hypothetical protein
MSNYIHDFEKELKGWFAKFKPMKGDQAWTEWKAGLTDFIKDKLLESFWNGLKARAKSPARRRPSPSR